jgi:hypothetical protein
MKYSKMLSLFFLLLLLSGVAYGYEVTDVNNGATLKGAVLFRGAVPPDEIVTIDRDSDSCGKTQKAGRYLISDQRVKNVVVWIEGIKKGKALPEKDVHVTIRNCRAEPLVSVGFVGRKFVLINDDDILHTIQLKLGLEYQKHVSSRPLKNGATIYNIALPLKGLAIKKPIKEYHRYSKETGFIRITSNTHTWIRGYVFVFDHPYAAVTDGNGAFEIKDIPPGEYLLKIWHEGFGMTERRITVKPGESKRIEIDLSGKVTGSGKSLNGAPSIRFVETRYRFGTIKEGEVISHDFEFVNTGSGVLRIVDLIPA